MIIFCHLVIAGYCGSVHFDGSLGSAGTLNGPNFLIPPEHGKQVGGNLFHSFGEFNLIRNEIASFQGPSNVRNILARVTGGSASNIDGTLRSEISGASLYFINPAGVLFGPNAQLDISGSFTVTTADYVGLNDGARFEAQPGANDVTLSTAPVSAFGFVSASPAPVSFNGSHLAAPPGRDFSVVAGDLSLDAAIVAAPAGRLTLVSAAAAGEISASFAALPARALPEMGTIALKNSASAQVNGNGGGRVVIRGGRLQVEGGSTVESKNLGGGRGANVDVRLTESLFIHDGQIRANVLGAGKGGNVRVDSPAIVINGEGLAPLALSSEDYNGIVANVAEDASGAGGNVRVLGESIRLFGTAFISTATFGYGNAGNVGVAATSLTLDRRGSPNVAEISSRVKSIAHGKGGNVEVFASNELSILSGSQIAADTAGHGDAGSVNVTSSKLRIDGDGSNFFTGIGSDVLEGAVGHGGDVNVRSDRLVITGHGQIVADTFGHGDEGNVSVTASKLRIDGQGLAFPSGISSNVFSNAVGHGGTITVSSDDLVIADHGEIVARTFGHGDAGSIHATAQNLIITQKATASGEVRFTGISAGARGETAIGDAGGNIVVQADRIIVEGPGNLTGSITGIEANTTGDGRGGNITVDATDSVELSGAAQFATNTYGAGAGGDISVRAPRLSLSGANTGLFAVSGHLLDFYLGDLDFGDAGNITVRANDLTIEGGGFIATSTFTEGASGNVFVTANNVLIRDPSEIPFIEAGITASSFNVISGGPAGNVNLRTKTLAILHGGAIATVTQNKSPAGDVNVVAEQVFISGEGASARTGIIADTGLFPFVSRSGIPISGRGGNGGTIRLNSALLDIRSGGEITASTRSGGGGGSIVVNSDRVSISGEGTESRTGIFSTTANGPSSGGGAGGRVEIRSHLLDLRAGGEISARTRGRGAGGSMDISARDIVISGDNRHAFTGINARTLGPDRGGAGGDIGLHVTGTLSLNPLGQISADTFGDGSGGGIGIDAAHIRIKSGGGLIAGVSAEAAEGSVGDGGNLSVSADDLFIAGAGALISASSKGPGRSGNVKVEAGEVNLSDGARVASGNNGTGEAGSVSVRADNLLSLDSGSLVTTSALSGDAGEIGLSSGDRIEVRDSDVTASAGVNGGSIQITAPHWIELRDSRISATAGAVVRTSQDGVADATGTGGNISIDPEFIILDHSLISANAAFGRGGNIFLSADNFLSSATIITATGATSGTVEIAAPELDLAASLVILPGALVDASTQLRELCAHRLGLDFSSFLVIGRGGVSLSPDEPLSSGSAHYGR